MDEADEITGDHSQESDATLDITAALDGLPLTSRSSGQGIHRDALVHALLEERCLHEVRNEYRAVWDEVAIRAEASRRYRRLCAVLAPHNLITSGLENDQMADMRQRYRDGLDMLSRNEIANASTGANIQAPSRRLVTNGAVDPSAVGNPRPLPLTRQVSDAASVFDTMTTSHPVLEPSRYLRDFEEISLLGKGGYGMVFRVRHRLDGLDYAVKKVPISAARIARIKARGPTELDDLLKELRTMARLDHPNVVRYFAGWIERSSIGAIQPSSHALFSDGGRANDVRSTSEDDAVFGAQDSSTSLGRVITQSDSDSAGIIFENTVSQDNAPEDASAAMFQQSLDTSSTSQSGANALVRTAEPTLALHVQMGLYPLTLADFISPPRTSEAQPLAHCFHLEPSISIILALLEGVEYLHSEGVVHRDLKPANVFLGANVNPRSTRGSVDLFLCGACRATHEANPVTLNVRIGDFGLVTALAQPEEDDTSRRAPVVGTEIYRPIHPMSNASASLDIFALGIVAFELLWKFDTRMSLALLLLMIVR